MAGSPAKIGFLIGGHVSIKPGKMPLRFTRAWGVIVLGMLWILGTSLGCRPAAKSPPPPSSPVEELGKLPGLRKTTLQALREELARIEEEGGTPEQMTPRVPPNDENLAAVFHDLFPVERVEFLLAKSGEWLKPGLRWDETAIAALHQFLAPWGAQRKAVRKGLNRPKCVFPIAFTAGFAADLRFLDQVILAVHLELISALGNLAERKTGPSLDDLIVALRLSHYLSQAKHPQMRWEGARLRRKTLEVLQQAVATGDVSRDDLAKVAGVFQSMLATWPEDAETWKATRALGLHAYELVRVGRLFDLLTEQEAIRLRQEYDLGHLVETVKAHADQDELYYLSHMRRVIDLSRSPFYQWRAELERLHGEWQGKSADPEVFVACRILLPVVMNGQAIQAEDLANTRAWALALQSALGEAQPANTVNPLTGKPYWTESQGGWIYLSGIGTDLGHHGAIEIRALPPRK